MDEWIREDYFLMFDLSRTSLLPLRDIDKHLPLYKKKGEQLSNDRAPRLFTKDKLEKFGILESYELYSPIAD